MKVLVVGGGGREHAIVRKLKENKTIDKIYCAPGNGGISFDAAECVDIKATDVENMVRFAVENKMDYALVIPDDPLVLGMTDAMEQAGIKAFGPSKLAARIEGSKVFSKNLMKKYGIPTAKYEVFSDAEKAVRYIEAENTFPTVIKADGLALGKGVIIAQNLEEAKEAVRSIMEDKVFGASGNEIVIEEFLTGPEVSVLAFTDSKTIVPMVSSMDHKRALDGDQGLNTGGMGTIAPNPCYTEAHAKEAMETIFLPTIRAMIAEGCPFKGCLYFGLMLTPGGVKVIEYNCRFGDPETQVVLPLLKTDLFTIFQAVRDETLSEIDIEWSNKSAACVVMASGGYPQKYETGCIIEGLDKNGQNPLATVYHAGTKLTNGKIVTAGGRVLGVTATAPTLSEALERSYRSVETIHFDKAHYRKDIGKKAL